MHGKMRFIGLMIIAIWSVLSVSAGNNPTEIAVISQGFENGEMIYREDNGDIYVLSNLSGIWWLFKSDTYGAIPLNTNLDAPSGRYAPEMTSDVSGQTMSTFETN